MRSQGISQFYLYTPRTSANGMNHAPLPSQPKLVLIYRPKRDGTWVGLGWLVIVTCTCQNKCPAPEIEPGHGRPSQY